MFAIKETSFVTRVVTPDLRVKIDTSSCKSVFYTITIENRGSGVAKDLEVVCVMPEGLEGPCEYVYHKETRQVVFAADMLMPGDSLVFKIICGGTKQGSSKNIARLKYEEFDKEIIDEEGANVYGETIYTMGDCSEEKGGL